MADFIPAYEHMMANEGGYVLTNIPGDRGGQTYAGIARNMNSNWAGWALIDAKKEVPNSLVSDFYKAIFWVPMKGDEINSQEMATAIFDFSVNAGGVIARKLAQSVIKVATDGVFGDKTIAALNGYPEDRFSISYTLAKISRYRDICMRDRSQTKFLLGWISRALSGSV